jgi:hypothetical protein
MSSQSYIFNPTERTSAAAGDGFSAPRLTTTDRLAITLGTSGIGMMVYDTTLNNLFIWNGSAWESVPASGDAGANGAVQYNDNGIVTGATNFFYDKVNGNVGLGISPSAWNSFYDAVQVGAGGAVSGHTNSALSWFIATSNTFINSAGDWKYINNGYATRYLARGDDGSQSWSTSASGSAGDTVTFIQAMSLNAAGKLTVSGGSVALSASTSVSSGSNTISDNGTTPQTLRTYNSVDANNAVSRFLICDAGASVSRADIRSNGGLANYQANNVNLSDVRTKTDIKPLGSYWNKIKSLEVVTFKYKDQTHDDDNIGLIAQQVESVAPELIDADGFGETPEDGVPLKTIYTADLYHASIKALQEAMARIEALEAKLAK